MDLLDDVRRPGKAGAGGRRNGISLRKNEQREEDAGGGTRRGRLPWRSREKQDVKKGKRREQAEKTIDYGRMKRDKRAKRRARRK